MSLNILKKKQIKLEMQDNLPLIFKGSLILPIYKKSYNLRSVIYNFCGIEIRKKIPANFMVETVDVALFPSRMGLANRLFGMVNAIKRFNPKKMNIYWKDTGWVSSKFKDLFEFDNININEFNSREEIYNWENSKNEIIVNFPSPLLVSNDRVSRTLFNDNITEDVKKDFAPIFKHILPSELVKQRMNNVSIPMDCVALQIRNNYDWVEAGRNSSLESFINEIHKFPKETLFYLSCMNMETSKQIKENFPNRIIELPNKDYSSMVDAVADMYIMSKCSRAIYSWGSTFGEFAFWLSGATQKTVLAGKY